jgi:hypothetical protein
MGHIRTQQHSKRALFDHPLGADEIARFIALAAPTS